MWNIFTSKYNILQLKIHLIFPTDKGWIYFNLLVYGENDSLEILVISGALIQFYVNSLNVKYICTYILDLVSRMILLF